MNEEQLKVAIQEDQSIRKAMQEWYDAIKEAETGAVEIEEFEPETIELEPGVTVTHINGQEVETPETLLRVEHKADGTVDFHTDKHTFQNVYLQSIDFEPEPIVDNEPITVKFEYNMDFMDK